MAEDFEYKVRAHLQDDVSAALRSMSQQTQAAFASIASSARAAASAQKTLANQTKEVNKVFNTQQSSNTTTAKSFQNLTTNIVTLNRVFQQARNNARVLQEQLKGVQARIADLEKQQKRAIKNPLLSALSPADIQKNINSLRQQEREMKALQSSYNAFSTVRMRTQLALLNKDIGLVGNSLINFGKNLNYVGRNLTFALTIPIMSFVNYGINNLRKLDKEVVRTRKILDDAFATPEALDTFMKDLGDQLDILSFKSTDNYKSLGIARELVQGLAADFAQLGVQPEQIFSLVRLSAELEKIGDVDITVAKDFVTSAYQQSIRLQTTMASMAGNFIDTATMNERAIQMITGSLYSLNVIENKTVLSLKNIADAFPEMQGVATTFGLTMLEAGAFLAPMVAAGFELGASANSFKVSLQRIVAPTKQNKEMVGELSKALGEDFQFQAGIGIDTIDKLVDGFMALERSGYGTQGALEFFARLFGVRQGPRMEQSLRQLGIFKQALGDMSTDTSFIFRNITSNINKELQKIGIPKTFTATSLESIGEIARYTAEIEQKGGLQSQKVLDAINRGQAKSVEELQAKYGDFYKYIINESGKVIAVQALGPEQAKLIYEKELAAANNTVEAKLARSRETFKSFSRQIVPIFVDIIEAILPTLQKFTNWVANLPQSSKALIGLGLAFVALSGPMTTVVAIGSQLAGIFLKLTTGLMPKISRLFRMPSILANGLGETARGVGLAGTRLTGFGRILDSVGSKFPRFSKLLDTAFMGFPRYRNDMLKFGDTFVKFGSQRGLLLNNIFRSLLPPTVDERDISQISNWILELTGESLGRNKGRMRPLQTQMGAMFRRIFSGMGIDPFGEVAESVSSLNTVENNLIQTMLGAGAAIDNQSKKTTRKAKATTVLKQKLSDLKDEERKVISVVDQAGDSISGDDTSTKTKTGRRKPRGPAPIVLPGTPYEQAVRAQFPDIDKKVKDNLTKLQVKALTEQANKAGELTVEQILNPVAKAVQSPIDQLVEAKDKMLAELAGLQRKGPSSIEKRMEKLANLARSLGLSPSRASGVLFDFAEAADAMISKPVKAIEKVSKLAPLTKESILEAFDKSNVSVRALGREVSEGTIRAQQIIAEKLGSMGLTFQNETLKDIIDSISTGKAFDLASIIERLEMGKKVTKRQWSDLWQGIPRGATRSKLLSADIRGDIQEAILNDKRIKKATRQITGTREDWAIRATRDLFEDFDEGTVKDFVDRIKTLEEQYKSDPKMLRKIRELGRAVVLRTSGPGYQTYLTPERKALKGIELRPESIQMAEKIRTEIDRKEKILFDLLTKSESEAVKRVSSWQPRSMQQMLEDLSRGITTAREGATEAETKAVSGVTSRYSQRIIKIRDELNTLKNQLDLYANPASTIYARNMPIPRNLQELEDIASGIGRMDSGAGATGAVLEDVVKGRDATGFRDTALQAVEIARLEREGKFSLGTIPQSDVTRSRGRNIRDLILRRRKLNMMDKGRFLTKKFGMDKIIRLFDTRLMSIGPIAGILAAMTAMSEAPGGIISKIFGGAGAGGMMMAAGGGIDKNALQKTLLDEVVKRRGLKGDQAKKLKKTILDKFKAAGLDDWLTILNKPVDELGDSFKDVIANLKGVGEDMPGAKQSAKKLVEKLKGTGTQLKNGVRESAEKVATLIDKTLADPDYLDNLINKIPKQAQDAAERSAQKAKDGVVTPRGRTKGPVTPQTEKRRARQDAAKARAEKAVANEIEESVTEVAEDTSEKVVVESKSKKKGNKAVSEPAAASVIIDVEETTARTEVTVAKTIKDDLCELTDDVKRQIIAGLMAVHGIPGVAQEAVAETVIELKLAEEELEAVMAKKFDHLSDKYTSQYVALMTALGSGGGMIPPISPKTIEGAAGGFFSRSVNKFMGTAKGIVFSPLTSVAKAAGGAAVALGTFGKVLSFLPFGRQISAGLINRGTASIKTSGAVRESVLNKLIPDPSAKMGRWSKILKTATADIAGAGAGLLQLVNPLSIIAGLFKSIMTALKFGALFSGIGILLVGVVGAVMAVKSAIQNFEPIIAKLKDAWKNISESLQIIAQPLLDMINAFMGVKSASDATGSSLEKTQSSAKTAVAGIVAIIGVISKKFRDNADKIAKFVKDKLIPVLVTIINTIYTIGKIIYYVFTGNFDKAGNAGAELFMRIGNAFLSLVKAVIPILKNLLKVTAVAFGKLADFIFTAIVQAGSAALSWIAENADNLLIAIGKGVMAAALGGTTSDIDAFFSDLKKDLMFWEPQVDVYLSPEIDWTKGDVGKKLGAELSDKLKEGVDIGEWLLEKISFEQGWIESLVGSLLDGIDWLSNGLLGAVDSALGSIAESFREKFGREIDAPINIIPKANRGKIQAEIDEIVAAVSGALEQGGEELGEAVGSGAGDSIKKAVDEAIKDLQQRFVDLVTDFLGNQVSKYKEQLTDLLNEQKEKQLAYFDDQIAALDALEKAEEELTATKEYEIGRRRMIEERDLQRANYQRNRALAIYEGRVDDARTLDLEEEKNTRDFRDNLDKYDEDRASALQKQQRETVKAILEQQKKDAEKAFDEIVKNFEKFIEEIGKYGTYNQQELEEQFKKLQEAAMGASDDLTDAFKDYYLEIPNIIRQYTDPTIGFFKEPLDKLIEVAKQKFGLGGDSGASTDSILGNTALMMYEVGATFEELGPYTGQSFEDAFTAVITDYVTPIVDKMNETMALFDPATIFQKAIDNANMTLLREQQKLIDGMASLVKDMIDLLDPAIAQWVALKAAIEAAADAAANAGSPSPGGGGGGGGGDDDGGGIVPIPPRGDFKTMLNTNAWAIITDSLPTSLSDKKYSIYETLVRMWTDIYNKTATYSSLKTYLDSIKTAESSFLSKSLTTLKSKMPTEYGGDYKPYAMGGYVKKYGTGGFAVPGFKSTAVPALLHGGEFVINAKAVQNIGMATLQGLNNMRFASPRSMQSPQVTTINETKNVNIYVDNFIGQEQWFESMMKEYNIKIVPRNQKAAGLENRTISTYSGINRGI
jgi:hypothetical protein